MIAYLAALAPIIFGTTYLLTSDFLPPHRPLLAALMRSLPTGLALIIGTRRPDQPAPVGVRRRFGKSHRRARNFLSLQGGGDQPGGTDFF